MKTSRLQEFQIIPNNARDTLEIKCGTMWKYSTYPIILPASKEYGSTGKPRPPNYLHKDVLSMVWMLIDEKHAVYFDSAALCLYMLFRISKNSVYLNLLQSIENIFPWSGSTVALKRIIANSDPAHLQNFEDQKSFNTIAMGVAAERCQIS